MSKTGQTSYIPTVRAIVKMASALEEADTVLVGRYYKFKFKKVLKEWIRTFEIVSKPFMGSFMESSEEALQESYIRFSELAEGMSIKDEDRTALVLFYCKLKSSLQDLRDMKDDGMNMMINVLDNSTENVLKAIEAQYGDIFTITDSEGRTIQFVIEQYNSLGKAMFVEK